MSVLNVAVLGVGRIGRLHAENLAFRIPSARLVAVADVNRDAAQGTAAALRVPSAYDDPRRVLGQRGLGQVRGRGRGRLDARLAPVLGPSRHRLPSYPTFMTLRTSSMVAAAAARAIMCDS